MCSSDLGRGAYLHPGSDCLALAERKRVFARALRLAGPAELGRVRAYVEQVAAAGRP